MFQRAHAKQRQVDSTHARANELQPAIGTPGKRTLTMGSGSLGAPDRYTHAVESAKRELQAVRSTAFPAYIVALRMSDAAGLAKQIELVRTAIQVRHLLMTANQHVTALEKAMTHLDPMVQFLRASLHTLVTRASKLGVYRGAEAMKPQAFKDKKANQPASRGEGAQLARTSNETRHQPPASSKPAATSTAKVTTRRAQAPVAPAPRTRLARGTARYSAPVQRKATASPARTTDVDTVAAKGIGLASQPLPYLSTIQRAFGRHSLAHVRAQIGGAAATASAELGAKAYTRGNAVAFASEPDLHTVAHEAAHVIQQRAGVSLSGGLDGGPSDEYERHADQVADEVVAGRSVEHLFDHGYRSSSSSPAIQRKPADHAPSNAPQPGSPVLPTGYEAAEIKIEKEIGSLDIAITATLEYGKTGIQLSGDRLTALKNTASARINGFAVKLETALLNGELEGELFDGVSISFEASALKVGVGSDGESDTDLLSIGVKVEGDVSHWLGAPTDISLKIDGSVTVALGGKLAARLSGLVAAQIEQRMLATEIGAITKALEPHADAVVRLEAQIAELDANFGSPSAQRRLRFQVIEHQRQLAAGEGQLRGLVGRLEGAKQKANRAFAKLEGKVAKQVAKAMEKKVTKFVATKLMKLVPVLNAISVLMDVVDLIKLVRSLWKREYDTSGNGSAEAESGLSEGTGKIAPEHRKQADDAAGSSGFDGKVPAPDHRQNDIDEARRSLPASARSLVDAISVRGLHQAIYLDADQLRMIGLLVPPSLTGEEVRRVERLLRSKHGAVNSAEAAIEAIDQAVREVRFGAASPSPSLTGATSAEGRVPAEMSAVGGPITSPGQARGRDSEPEVSEDIAAIRGGAPDLIGQWFVARGEELVLSKEGAQWKATRVGKRVGDDVLEEVAHKARYMGADRWSLEVRFLVRAQQGSRWLVHSFAVDQSNRPASGIGARVGNLTFEPYMLIE